MLATGHVGHLGEVDGGLTKGGLSDFTPCKDQGAFWDRRQ